MNPRIVAVVVTWNRVELLRECLVAISQQTVTPANVVVVDNASSDSTLSMLSTEHPRAEVIQLGSNIGGAGGFAVGIQRALLKDPDFVWLLDDDTVPTPTAAERLTTAWERYSSETGDRVSLVASRAVWTDGREHPMNTPRVSPLASRQQISAAAEVGCSPIRSASFVSIMCDALTIQERGLPIADYFIWNDDFEYTTRLIRGRVGLHCRESVVVHKTATFGSTDVDPGERFFFEVRNKLWMFSRSTSLSLPEKVIYGASTLRRWMRTMTWSQDRKTLRSALGRGLKAALCTSPRANTEVLQMAFGPDFNSKG